MQNPYNMGELLNVSKLSWEMSETVRLLKGAPGTLYQECTDTDRKIFRDWIRSLLHQQAITVTFVKSDGTVRDMLCTLDLRKIPQDKIPKNDVPVEHLLTEPKRSTEHTLRVFDLEKGEWRSFRFERLKKISVVLEFR